MRVRIDVDLQTDGKVAPIGREASRSGLGNRVGNRGVESPVVWHVSPNAGAVRVVDANDEAEKRKDGLVYVSTYLSSRNGAYELGFHPPGVIDVDARFAI